MRPAGLTSGRRPRFKWRTSGRPLLVLFAVLAALSSALASVASNEQLKVAALASKLEQWFACRRQQQAVAALDGSAATSGQQQQQQVMQSLLPECPAHFDGHLCWPATAAGATSRQACPRLRWLPGQQLQQHWQAASQLQLEEVKSVINSIEGHHDSTRLESIKLAQTISQEAAVDRQRQVQQQQQQQQAFRVHFASRSCSIRLANKTISPSEWLGEANYSDCAQDGDLFDPNDQWIKLDEESDRRLFARLVDELDRIEGAIDPYSDPDLQQQWSLCISNIMRHPEESGQQPAASCPVIFDGWRCWPSTRAGEIAYVSCPSNQPGFSAERNAHKICTQNGTWYKHPMTNRYWSNYTTCVDTVDLAFRTKILNLYVTGNLISLVALAASLIIFISFKSLNCTRVTIHKNLFLSFITNNLMWIIWYTYVVNDANLLQSNPIECQLWHILLHYFLVSNYFWMFCEGLYLHTLLVVAFVSEDKIIKWFYLLGWLTPVPITVAYAYNRSYDDYYTNFCWMEESPYNLILMAPIGISLLLNLIFLINIVRVLVTKLRANNSPDTHQTRKAVRATLILIPLLGLHYILTPFRPEAKSEYEFIYESIAAVCTSFQGLCVAMLFCFCNSEVIAVIKKKLKDSCNLSYLRPGQKRKTRGSSLPTLRSVISSSGLNGNNNGAVNHIHQPRTPVLMGNRSNGTNSNSGSLITNVTVSPLQQVISSNNGTMLIQESASLLIASERPQVDIQTLDEATTLLSDDQVHNSSVTTSFSLA